jgi:hypothetical protein
MRVGNRGPRRAVVYISDRSHVTRVRSRTSRRQGGIGIPGKLLFFPNGATQQARRLGAKRRLWDRPGLVSGDRRGTIERCPEALPVPLSQRLTWPASERRRSGGRAAVCGIPTKTPSGLEGRHDGQPRPQWGWPHAPAPAGWAGGEPWLPLPHVPAVDPAGG